MTVSPTSVSQQKLSEANLSECGEDGFFALLKNRGFRFLWLGQVASQLGDRIVFVVFIAMITATFGANDSYNSGLYIAFTIPAIALTAIAGVFVDRWPRRQVLVVTNLIRAAVVAVLPFALNVSLWAVYGVAFMVSAATQFFVPAESASIPALVPKQQLVTANSLFTTTMMMSVVFGFSLSDPLIELLGLQSVHWAIVGLFVLASVLLTQVRIPKVIQDEMPDEAMEKKSETVGEACRTLWHDLKDGFVYLKSEPVILIWMMILAILFSAVVSMCILLIGFAREVLYADPAIAARKFAHIITVSGLGMGLGAACVKPLLGIRGISSKRLVTLSLIGLSVTIGALLLTPSFSFTHVVFRPFGLALGLTERIVWTYGVSALMGVCAAFVAVPTQSEIHERIAENMRGKMMGIQFTLLSTSSTFPVIVTGLGAQWLGTSWMIALLSCPLLLAGVYGLLCFKPNANASTHLH